MSFLVLTPCWVCMLVVLWVDVQTGCVWAGAPLSVHLFAALILGFVCSIWPKFSNGDNYRGRPGERRRWVQPFYRVSCMLLQASQLHLPASSFVYFSFQSPTSLKLQLDTEAVVLPNRHSQWLLPLWLTFISLHSLFSFICLTNPLSQMCFKAHYEKSLSRFNIK